MKRSSLILTIAAVTLIVGCQSGIWYDPGRTLAEARQDCRECMYDAARATAGTISGVQAGWESADLMHQCMTLRGYGWYRQVPEHIPTAAVHAGNMHALVAGPDGR